MNMLSLAVCASLILAALRPCYAQESGDGRDPNRGASPLKSHESAFPAQEAGLVRAVWLTEHRPYMERWSDLFRHRARYPNPAEMFLEALNEAKAEQLPLLEEADRFVGRKLLKIAADRRRRPEHYQALFQGFALTFSGSRAQDVADPAPVLLKEEYRLPWELLFLAPTPKGAANRLDEAIVGALGAMGAAESLDVIEWGLQRALKAGKQVDCTSTIQLRCVMVVARQPTSEAFHVLLRHIAGLRALASKHKLALEFSRRMERFTLDSLCGKYLGGMESEHQEMVLKTSLDDQASDLLRQALADVQSEVAKAPLRERK